MPKGMNLDIMGQSIGTKLTELSFSMGILVGSAVVGYFLVSGKFKNCMDFYGIMDSQVQLMQK